MSFKLIVEINDDGSSNIDFDGTVNHILLLGVLESIKFSTLSTIDFMITNGAASEEAAPAQPEV